MLRDPSLANMKSFSPFPLYGINVLDGSEKKECRGGGAGSARGIEGRQGPGKKANGRRAKRKRAKGGAGAMGHGKKG